ncbi:MAG TPA: hypothetical protein VM369_11185, partial [Candidatus Binatia bacterium]|nr:hypothetical protein [Candidatus Binatia bacterium]
NDVLWYVAMTTADATAGTAATPAFEFGKTGIVDAVAATAGTFEKLGDLDAASHFDADGTIVLVFDPSAMNLAPGATMYGVYAKTRGSTVNETMSFGLTNDDTGIGGDYTLIGNAACGGAKVGGSVTGALAPGVLVVLAVGALRRRRAGLIAR